MEKSKGKWIALHMILVIYSIVSVLSKQAAEYPFLSGEFIIFYGAMIVCLGVYAILWQQILKRIPLGIAFANKAIVIIWGIIWGEMFFGEAITIRMIIGAIVIVIGIILVVSEKEGTE